MSTQTPPAPTVRPAAASVWLADGGRRAMLTVVLPLLAASVVAWVVTARGETGMMLGAGSFLLAWLIMMVAMMLPAAAPVVALYTLAARRRVVAATPAFVTGYLFVWALTGAPAYVVARSLDGPLMEGDPWVGRLVGTTLVVAGLYQLTPLKHACLRRCRSPLSFYLTRTGSLSHPGRAVVAGAEHGLYCLGCCWALMAVLVVVGGMQLGWALALALVISAEKLVPAGRWPALLTAATAATFGVALLLDPSLLAHLILM